MDSYEIGGVELQALLEADREFGEKLAKLEKERKAFRELKTALERFLEKPDKAGRAAILTILTNDKEATLSQGWPKGYVNDVRCVMEEMED